MPGTVKCPVCGFVVDGTHRCGEQAAALAEFREAADEERRAAERAAAEEREHEERVAAELRAKLVAAAAASEKLGEDLDQRRLAEKQRLAEERRRAAERTKRWLADRAEEKRLGTEESGRITARQLQEKRRLEAIVARRRWKEKAAWRQKSDPPKSAP